MPFEINQTNLIPLQLQLFLKRIYFNYKFKQRVKAAKDEGWSQVAVKGKVKQSTSVRERLPPQGGSIEAERDKGASETQ